MDLIFIVDMFVSFNLAYGSGGNHGSQGFLWVQSHKKIARNYLTSWFLVDFISIVPVDLIAMAAMGEVDGADSTGNASKLRAIKTIRLLRLLKLARIIRARYAL